MSDGRRGQFAKLKFMRLAKVSWDWSDVWRLGRALLGHRYENKTLWKAHAI